jgi:ABC-type Fe3+/spermidine/putrescine transport system ATPase subunit
MNVIEVNQVKKDYPLGKTTVHALRGAELEVAEGAFLSIIGPSGSGKTTLLNIIGCIDIPSAGSVKIQDQEITTLNDQQITDLRLHKIGFIFQTFNLIPVLNVREIGIKVIRISNEKVRHTGEFFERSTVPLKIIRNDITRMAVWQYSADHIGVRRKKINQYRIFFPYLKRFNSKAFNPLHQSWKSIRNSLRNCLLFIFPNNTLLTKRKYRPLSTWNAPDKF